MVEVFRLFPTPFMRAPETLNQELVAGLVEHFVARATRDNTSSKNLAHTEMLRPSDSPLPVAVVRNVGCAFSQVEDPVVE